MSEKHSINTISIIGCGWLGLPLGAYLKSQGYWVKGSTTNIEKVEALRAAGIEPHLLRLNPEPEEENNSLFDADILVVNIPPRNGKNSDDFHERQLLYLARTTLKEGLSKIIFISSTSVYPNLNREVVEGDASYASESRAGISLLKMEDIFRKEKHLDTTIIRFGGLYGPGRHPGRFLQGKSDLSGGENPVNMIHLDDCIQIIHQIILKGFWNQTYNASSPNQLTRKQFYQQAAEELGISAPSFSSETKEYKKVNSDKLIRDLDFKFTR